MSAGITETATVYRLLIELDHGRRTLRRGVVVVLDEAAMCSTRRRLAATRRRRGRRQYRRCPRPPPDPSVDVGGGHHALASRLGASVLGQNHRFRDPVYRDAAKLLRDRQAAAAVHLLRDKALNSSPATHTYRAPDDHRAITLAVGDEIILRRNHRLAQPDGPAIAVRNGMTGHVISTSRRGIAVELAAAHRPAAGPATMTLSAAYVGAHVDHGYAHTVDTAQGTTVDYTLFIPSTGSSAERPYVALSRWRLTNRIHATRDSAWMDAIGRARDQGLAVDQEPVIGRTRHSAVHRQALARDHQHPEPLGLGI